MCYRRKGIKKLDIRISAILVKNELNYVNHKKNFKIKKIYTDLKLLLKYEKYDFIMVLLPWYSIEKNIQKIIKFSKSKFIFSEKPISLSRNNLQDIIPIKIMPKL